MWLQRPRRGLDLRLSHHALVPAARLRVADWEPAGNARGEASMSPTMAEHKRPRRGYESPTSDPDPSARGEARIADSLRHCPSARGEADYRRHLMFGQRPRRGLILRLPVVVAVLCALTAACTPRPLIPPSVTRHHSPVPAVAVTADPVLGVDLYVQRDYPSQVLAVDGARDLAYIHHHLHAAAVGFVWNYDTPSNSSDTVRSTSITLPPAGLAELTRQAEADGLAVQFRPLIRVGPREKWEGAIRPASQAAWFTSLWRAERPYLRLAQRLHVGTFVVASEMEYMNSAPGWARFLTRAREVFHGQVTMSLWDGNYLAGQVPAGLSSAVGMDPYPNTGLPDGASQARVTAAWRRVFASIPAAVRFKTTLDEVGFIAESGAYETPQEWHRVAPANYRMQERWFTAVCRTVAYYHMAGVFFYDMNLAVNPAVPNIFPGFFTARPGAAAIARCSRSLK
jgi:hypothetical protein